MARFNISYTITAIDKFSEIADRLRIQLGNVRDALDKAAASTAKDTHLIDDKLKYMAANATAAMEKTASAVSRESFTINEKLRSVKNHAMVPISVPPINFKPAKSSIERFNHWAEGFAFRGFINSMNVIMPMMLVFGKPFKDLIAQQKAIASMTTSGLNVGALKEQADKLSKVSTFSVSDILSSQAILAAKDANQQNIQKIMRVAVDVAAKNNESLKQAVQQINQAIFARGKVSTVGGLVVHGLTEHQRINSLISQAGSLKGTALAQAQTTTGRLTQSFNNLSDALTKFLIAATPAFNTLAKVIDHVSTVVSNFVTHHKHLTKLITEAAIAVMGLVAAQVVLGAVMVGLSMATKIAKVAMVLFKIATFNYYEVMKITKAMGIALTAVEETLAAITTRAADSYLALGIRMLAAKVKMAALKVATIAYRGILLALRGAMIAFNVVMTAFNVLMDANPIGMVIVAIGALIAGVVELIRHWKTVKRVFFEVCKAIAHFIKEWILKPIEHLWHYIEEYIDPAISRLEKLAHLVSHVVRHPIASTEHAAKGVVHIFTHPLVTLSGGGLTKANLAAANAFLTNKQQAMQEFNMLSSHHMSNTVNVHLHQSGTKVHSVSLHNTGSSTFQNVHMNLGATHMMHE